MCKCGIRSCSIHARGVVWAFTQCGRTTAVARVRDGVKAAAENGAEAEGRPRSTELRLHAARACPTLMRLEDAGRFQERSAAIRKYDNMVKQGLLS